MSADRKRCLRRFLLASIYMLGVLGILGSGGGGGSSSDSGDDNDPVTDSKCEIGSSKIGDCNI
jgi:hypothetical protein